MLKPSLELADVLGMANTQEARQVATDPQCECMLSFSVLEVLSQEAHVALHTGDAAGIEKAWLEAVWQQFILDGMVAA